MKSRYSFRAPNSLLGVVVACLFLLFLLVGCGFDVPKPNTVTNQEDLGSVHVTVFPLVDFEDHKERLKPKFTLSGDSALNKVAPTTSSLSKNQIKSIASNLSLGFPTKEVTKTLMTKTVDGVDTSSEERKSTSKSGNIPEDEVLSESIRRVIEGESKDNEISNLDPLTKYWTAAALYQEVQLLNEYISDINLDDKYQAFITRVQISQIPYIRRAPYDAIVDLSFFVQSKGKDSGTTLPIVLPMLVTDNLELSNKSYHLETVRNLSLALQGMIGNVGLKVGTDAYNQLITEILGHDINSLLTVGRLHNNILRVRLGAMQQGGGLYAVVPHTQTVSLVVLIRKKENTADGYDLIVTSKTEWKHTSDPEKNPIISDSNFQKYLKKFNKFSVDIGYSKISIEEFNKIITAYNDNDFDEFKKYFKPKSVVNVSEKKGEQNFFEKFISRYLIKNVDLTNVSYSDASIVNQNNIVNSRLLWGKLASIIASSQFDQSSVQIPRFPEKPKIDENEGGIVTSLTKLYLFADKEKMLINIPTIGGRNPNYIYGECKFSYSKSGSRNGEFSIFSTSTKADHYGRGIVLTFPSVTKEKYPDLKIESLSLYWIYKENSDSKASDIGAFTNVHLVTSPKEDKPSTSIVISDNKEFVAIKEGAKGDIRLSVKKFSAEEEPFVIVDGARLSKSSNSSIAMVDESSNSMKILGVGDFEVTLENLIDSEFVSLVIHLKGKDIKETIGNLQARKNQ